MLGFPSAFERFVICGDDEADGEDAEVADAVVDGFCHVVVCLRWSM